MKLVAFLRWILWHAITLVVAVLVVRGIVEFVPRMEAWPPVRAALGRIDPVLSTLVQTVGLPWSRDVRGLVLPGVGVALIVLRNFAEDLLDRLIGALRRRAPRWPVAASPPAAKMPTGTAMPAAAAAAVAAAPAGSASPAAAESTVLKPAGASADVNATAALPADLAPTMRRGFPVIGRYEIVEELGRGAMGVVYKALDPRIGRTVAIKTISAAGSGPDFDEYRARFMVEAKSAGRLLHPGIVAVYDVTEDENGKPSLVLEYVEGQTLDRLARPGPLPLPRVLEIVAQVARALGYAHANGIIHRDIKPANIMITRDGRTKLSDFGIAKLDNISMTTAGQVMGTPAFMSPEQCSGTAVTPRSDIFSLGTVLYLLCTGERPFPGDTFTSVAYQVVHDEPPPLQELKQDLPPPLNDIIGRCLAKLPEQRYTTAEQLAADLEALRTTLA